MAADGGQSALTISGPIRPALPPGSPHTHLSLCYNVHHVDANSRVDMQLVPCNPRKRKYIMTKTVRLSESFVSVGCACF